MESRCSGSAPARSVMRAFLRAHGRGALVQSVRRDRCVLPKRDAEDSCHPRLWIGQLAWVVLVEIELAMRCGCRQEIRGREALMPPRDKSMAQVRDVSGLGKTWLGN